jgi:hypothetical protein
VFKVPEHIIFFKNQAKNVQKELITSTIEKPMKNIEAVEHSISGHGTSLEVPSHLSKVEGIAKG